LAAGQKVFKEVVEAAQKIIQAVKDDEKADGSDDNAKKIGWFHAAANKNEIVTQSNRASGDEGRLSHSSNVPRGGSSKFLEDSTDAPDNSGLVQVIGRHLHLHAVADGEAHEPLAHFAGNGRQHLMLVVQLDAKHRSGQDRQNAPLNFDVFFHESGKSADGKPSRRAENLAANAARGGALLSVAPARLVPQN
jgi:hypothetical protein